MTITKGNGGYIIDAIVRDRSGNKYLDTKQYIYYTRKEAIAMYRKYLKDNNLVEVK